MKNSLEGEASEGLAEKGEGNAGALSSSSITKGVGKYWIARTALLRYMGCLWFVAFFTASMQNRGLLGAQGLTPYSLKMEAILQQSQNETWRAFWRAPSLLWFVGWTDEHLLMLSNLGLLLSMPLVFLGSSNVCINFLLWVLYQR